MTAITGPVLDRALGATVPTDTTRSCRAARLLGMPRLGSGARRTFTLGQAVAAIAAHELAGHPHQQARTLVYQHVPYAVDVGDAEYVTIVAASDPPWVTWGAQPAVEAVLDHYRTSAVAVVVVNVAEAVALIDAQMAVPA